MKQKGIKKRKNLLIQSASIYSWGLPPEGLALNLKYLLVLQPLDYSTYVSLLTFCHYKDVKQVSLFDSLTAKSAVWHHEE